MINDVFYLFSIEFRSEKFYEYPRHTNKIPAPIGITKLSRDFRGNDSIILEKNAVSKAGTSGK